jgi:tetratricopeptide (TPR) repeat protein
MSIELGLSKIQSLGQRLDHLAFKSLPEQAIERYLIAKNMTDIVFRQNISNLPKRPPSTFIEVDEDSNYDDFETQIIKRPVEKQNKTNRKTIQSLTDALDDNFHSTSLWLERGLLWQKEGNYAAALSDFLRAFQLNKNDQSVRQSLYELQKICTAQGKQIDLASILEGN